MKYNLIISRHNIKPHLDIENDIQAKKNGLFTFNLRISQGNIEDYATFETVRGGDIRTTVFSPVKESSTTRSY